MTPEEYRALADRLQGQESLLTEAQTAQFLAHPAANRQSCVCPLFDLRARAH